MKEFLKTYGNKTYKMQEFENLFETYNHIRNTKDINKYKLAKNECLGSFYGSNDFEKVMENLKYGKEKETHMYLSKIKQLNNNEGTINNAYFMDVEGFAYDMGAVVAGEPECCINQGAPMNKPTLKLYIDTGYCGSVSSDIIANRGVAIYQLISNLLAKGYILEIKIIHYIDAYGDYYGQIFNLSTDYLTTSQLAFTGTCEFFRIITWLLTAIQKEEKSYTGGGCSMPTEEVIKELNKEGLYIPSGYTDSRFNDCSLEQAIDYVIEIYNNYLEAKCR